MKFLIHSLLLLVLSSFLMGESWAIESSLPPCSIEISRSEGNNCYGSNVWPNGDKYVGEWKDCARHGQGTHTWPGRRLEEGILEKNKFLYAQKITPKRAPELAESNKVLQAGSGTGFAISPVGHVVTNNHVINGCNNVMVHHKGTTIKTTVLASNTIRSEKNCLEVMKVQPDIDYLTLCRYNPAGR